MLPAPLWVREDWRLTNTLLCQRLFCNAAVFAVVGVLFTQPGSAQGDGDIVRGLNAVINPNDPSVSKIRHAGTIGQPKSSIGAIIAPASKIMIGPMILVRVASMEIVVSIPVTLVTSALTPQSISNSDGSALAHNAAMTR